MRIVSSTLAGLLIGLTACSGPADSDNTAGGQPALKSRADFPLGVAVPAGPARHSLLASRERQAIVNRHFDRLTAENIMKMVWLQPAPGEFVFEHADALLEYAERNGHLLHGHVLVWHTQVPDWMEELSGTREEMIDVLETHIRTVAGRYAGRMASWDVVNEAFDDETPAGWRSTIWYEGIGPEYVELAFRAAREADPHAELYYNDYGISGAGGPAKLDRVLELIDDFRQRGVPIDGIGFQMHIDTERPSLDAVRESFRRAARRGIRIRISELDVSVNVDNAHSELSAELAELQRRHYADIARIYREEVPPGLRAGITLWGITDGDSWIPGFRGRPDWPLLFDAEFHAKPAFHGFAEGLGAPPE